MGVEGVAVEIANSGVAVVVDPEAATQISNKEIAACHCYVIGGSGSVKIGGCRDIGWIRHINNGNAAKGMRYRECGAVKSQSKRTMGKCERIRYLRVCRICYVDHVKTADTCRNKRVGVVYDDIQRISKATVVAADDGGTSSIKQVNNIQASVAVIVRNVNIAPVGGECETACKSGSRNTVCFRNRAPINRCK